MTETPGVNALTTNGFWSERYRGVRPGSLEWFKPLLRRKRHRMLGGFLDQVAVPVADVLELGCAPGDCLMHLHRVRPQHRLHGIDFSETGVRLARERLRQRGIDATIYCGDFRDMELPLKFHLVMSFGLIEHFSEPASILRDHARFCQPGGRVVATVPNYSTPVNRCLMRLVDPDNLRAHNLEIMDLDTIRGAFVAAGLTDVQVGSAGGPRIFAGGDRRLICGRINRCLSRVWNVAACWSPVDLP